MLIDGLDLLHHLKPAQPRHLDIQHAQIRLLRQRQLHGVDAVTRLKNRVDFELGMLHKEPQRLALERLIVDNQQLIHPVSPPCFPRPGSAGAA